jgi:hypothetical protein
MRLFGPSTNEKARTTPSPHLPALHGLGTRKVIYHVGLTLGDTKQFESAKYYRLAEKNGNKIIGNTWYVERLCLLSSALHDSQGLVFPLDNRRCPLLPQGPLRKRFPRSPTQRTVAAAIGWAWFVLRSRMSASADDLRPAARDRAAFRGRRPHVFPASKSARPVFLIS